MNHGRNELPKPKTVQPPLFFDENNQTIPRERLRDHLFNGGKETSVADGLLQYLESDMEDRDMLDAYEGY